MKHGKPDPEPYEAAIKKLDINRLNCIVVENAPLGIESAKAAKVDYVIAVATTLPDSYLSKADDIMSSVSDLEQCLAQRFKARPGRAMCVNLQLIRRDAAAHDHVVRQHERDHGLHDRDCPRDDRRVMPSFDLYDSVLLLT